MPELSNRAANCASLAGVALAALLLPLAGTAAKAVVGTGSADPSLSAHIVMVLKKSSAGSGFCSGVVIARQSVLTAGHCVADASALSVYVPGGALLSVDTSAVHPLYRADAVRQRVRSVDLAMVHLAAPLSEALAPASLSHQPQYGLGSRLRIAGFGEGVEGDGSSGGKLRVGVVEVRAPLSSLLLWLEGAGGEKTGACEGDSGGGTFDTAGNLAGIVDWAEGDGAAECGSLTQSALIAPQRGWIDTILKKWRDR